MPKAVGQPKRDEFSLRSEMSEVEKTRTWRSIHTDFLGFAVSAYRGCQEKSPPPIAGTNLHRHAINTIRYSYDCLESSAAFVYNMGRLKQLRISIPTNWLTGRRRCATQTPAVGDRGSIGRSGARGDQIPLRAFSSQCGPGQRPGIHPPELGLRSGLLRPSLRAPPAAA